MKTDVVIELPLVGGVIGAIVLIAANTLWVYYIKRQQRNSNSLAPHQSNDTKE